MKKWVTFFVLPVFVTEPTCALEKKTAIGLCFLRLTRKVQFLVLKIRFKPIRFSSFMQPHPWYNKTSS